jgi:dolichol-phosphate mannosyltransferase
MNSNQSYPLLPTPKGSLLIQDIESVKPVPRFSLITPTYQESKNIPALVQQLTSLLDAELPGQYELIIVDDDSPDHTWEVAQSLMEKYPQLRVMRRTQERGLSSAVIRGWQMAQGEILGVIDADLQHPPGILAQLFTSNDSKS